MATYLAACRTGGTEPTSSFSLLPANLFPEDSTTQSLTSEVQREYKICLKITQQLHLWSWIDPETSHLEIISHVPLKLPLEVHGRRSPVTFKGRCFVFELAWLPFPTSSAKSPIDNLISPSHTYLDFPFWEVKKKKPQSFEG